MSKLKRLFCEIFGHKLFSDGVIDQNFVSYNYCERCGQGFKNV